MDAHRRRSLWRAQGAHMGHGIRHRAASAGIARQPLAPSRFASSQVRGRLALVTRSAPSRIRTCAHGSGGRFNLANYAICLPGFDRSSPGRLRLFRVYSGSWKLPVSARTLQGMARVRSGQALAWPLVPDRSVRRGSSVKHDFACTFTRHFPPALVALRSQSCLMLEGRTRTLSGPSPDLSPIRASGSIRTSWGVRLTDCDVPEARHAGARGLACCRVRKRWGLDAPVGSFVRHLDVGSRIRHLDVGSRIRHLDVGSFVYHVDVGSTVINGSAHAIHGCVVLPAH